MFSLHHLHPILVHFPIVLTLLGCFLQFIEQFIQSESRRCNCGEYILYMATLATVITLLSGMILVENFQGEASVLKEKHQIFAVFTMILLGIATLMYVLSHIVTEKSNSYRFVGFVFYFFAAASVTVTGYYGGSLVYNFMVVM